MCSSATKYWSTTLTRRFFYVPLLNNPELSATLSFFFSLTTDGTKSGQYVNMREYPIRIRIAYIFHTSWNVSWSVVVLEDNDSGTSLHLSLTIAGIFRNSSSFNAIWRNGIGRSHNQWWFHSVLPGRSTLYFVGPRKWRTWAYCLFYSVLVVISEIMLDEPNNFFCNFSSPVIIKHRKLFFCPICNDTFLLDHS